MKRGIRKGGLPMQPAYVTSATQRAMRGLIQRMLRDVREQLRTLPWRELQPIESRVADELGLRVGDAPNIAERAASLMQSLMAKWAPLFDVEAESIATRMTAGAVGASNLQLGRSMRELGEAMTLKIGPQLQLQIDAATQEAAALIKRVPAQYLPEIQGDVMRSITSGNGLQDLIPALEARQVKIKNWAQNTARDQTRKAYSNISRVRMQEAGLEEYEWVHSGGANQPREHHMHRFPAGLNGGIFRWDDPPVADERTGYKAHPGVLVNCGCIARPVLRIKEAKDAD